MAGRNWGFESSVNGFGEKIKGEIQVIFQMFYEC